MKKMIVLIMFCSAVACHQVKDEPPIGIADPKYSEMARGILISLCKGDLDGFIKSYTDDATYRWNFGDSLVGRQAIYDYWNERRSAVIDTITFKNEAWLAIIANHPPEHIQPGVYVLHWADFKVDYINGSSLNMNIHTVFGFNEQGQVVSTLQYLDRSLIADALMAKSDTVHHRE
jgi:hypothetical protein